MAVEFPILPDLSFQAGADLSTAQYKWVKFSGTTPTVILCAAVTDIPCGVLQNNPASGENAQVRMLGISKVDCDAALATPGTQVGTSADGQTAAYVAGTDTTKYIVGTIIYGAGAAGRKATAAVNCMNAHRGA